MPTARPIVTAASLADDLRTLGLRPGSTALVHTSLSSLGWVVGAEQAVVDALHQSLGPAGTLVMPTQSWQLCDPAFLNEPNVPQEWWPTIRANLPVYDPPRTPTRTMGAVAELFRTQPGTMRSSHPHRSFAAAGPNANEIVETHELTSPVGDGSPLAALYRMDAQILLLGVGYDKSTALHLAEDRCDFGGKHTVHNGAPMIVDGQRQWVEWDEMCPADDDFNAVGHAFADEKGLTRIGKVGRAEAKLIPMREFVDFAQIWFAGTRKLSKSGQA